MASPRLSQGMLEINKQSLSTGWFCLNEKDMHELIKSTVILFRLKLYISKDPELRGSPRAFEKMKVMFLTAQEEMHGVESINTTLHPRQLRFYHFRV